MNRQNPTTKLQNSTIRRSRTQRHARRTGFRDWSSKFFLSLGFGVWSLLTGCSVGPNHHRPPIEAPPTFRHAPPQPPTNSLAELPWWEVFRDETLTTLIRSALTNNYDMRIARANQEQARALAMRARSEFLPQVGYEGEAARGKNVILGNPAPVGAGATSSGFVGVLNASWELDLW